MRGGLISRRIAGCFAGDVSVSSRRVSEPVLYCSLDVRWTIVVVCVCLAIIVVVSYERSLLTSHGGLSC